MSKRYRARIAFEAAARGAAKPASDSGGSPPAAVQAPRLVTRGESSPGPRAIVDWLSFTVDQATFANTLDWVSALADYLAVPELTSCPGDRGIAGFTRSADLVLPCETEAVIVGKLAWGGSTQNERVYLTLSGTLCARVRDWVPLGMVLHLCDARITRADLAHDDFEGNRSVDDAVAMYDAGQFNSGGRNPSCSLQGDWKQVSGKGRTFYVGNRKHGKLLRVYEKGRQLGDSASPWVRWEVQLQNRDRWIPYDVLSRPAPFLAGSFPALGFVCEEREVVRTQRKVVQASLDHLVTWLSKSYGKTINALRLQGFDAEDIMAQVMRPGLPSRLQHAIAGSEPGSKLYDDEFGKS